MEKILKRLDYFFVLRPMLFYPGWSTFLAGYLMVYKTRFFLSPGEWLQFEFREIGLLFVAFATAMGGSFLLNQLADVQSDRENKKLFLISEGHIPRKNAIIEVIVLFVLAIGLTIFRNWQLSLVLAIFILITGYFYNFPPFKFKDRPWWSLWANMSMGFLAFCLGWLTVYNRFNWQMVVDSLPYLFLNTALYFYTTLPDIEGDRAAGKRTLAVQWGVSRIVVVAFGLFVAALVSACLLNDRLALLIVLPSAPFFVLTLRKRTVSSTIRTTKFTILFFALAVCLKIPFYFLLMVSGFFFTRWYFKQRFQFDYPNFDGKG